MSRQIDCDHCQGTGLGAVRREGSRCVICRGLGYRERPEISRLISACEDCFRYGTLCAVHRAASDSRHVDGLRALQAALDAVGADVAAVVEDEECMHEGAIRCGTCDDCGEDVDWARCFSTGRDE